MSNCIFVEDSDKGDTRKFKMNEPVCLRDGHFTEGTYQGAHPQPGTGRVYTHKITSGEYPNRMVSFHLVGKKPVPVSPTALNVVFKDIVGNANFAKHFSRVGYGGKRKTRKGRGKKHKKVRKHTARKY